MQYSRKGWWISKTASLAVVVAFFGLVFWLRPGRPMAGLMEVAVLAIAFTFGIRAFFYRDEVERQTRMRCWFFGCQIGAVIAALTTVSIFAFSHPAPGAIINVFSHALPMHPVAPFPFGFVTGLLTLALPQAICALLVRAYLFLPKRGS